MAKKNLRKLCIILILYEFLNVAISQEIEARYMRPYERGSICGRGASCNSNENIQGIFKEFSRRNNSKEGIRPSVTESTGSSIIFKPNHYINISSNVGLPDNKYFTSNKKDGSATLEKDDSFTISDEGRKVNKAIEPNSNSKEGHHQGYLTDVLTNTNNQRFESVSKSHHKENQQSSFNSRPTESGRHHDQLPKENTSAGYSSGLLNNDEHNRKPVSDIEFNSRPTGSGSTAHSQQPKEINPSAYNSESIRNEGHKSILDGMLQSKPHASENEGHNNKQKDINTNSGDSRSISNVDRDHTLLPDSKTNSTPFGGSGGEYNQHTRVVNPSVYNPETVANKEYNVNPNPNDRFNSRPSVSESRGLNEKPEVNVPSVPILVNNEERDKMALSNSGSNSRPVENRNDEYDQIPKEIKPDTVNYDEHGQNPDSTRGNERYDRNSKETRGNVHITGSEYNNGKQVTDYAYDIPTHMIHNQKPKQVDTGEQFRHLFDDANKKLPIQKGREEGNFHKPEDTNREQLDLGGYNVPKDVDYKYIGNDQAHGNRNQKIPLLSDCTCVPYYQCKDGQIVTDGAGIIDARSRSYSSDERPLDGDEGPAECGAFHVCCRAPETSTVRPYQHRCGTRNPSGINSRVLAPSNKGEADFGEWPWQAAILKSEGKVNIFMCGGVLIDKSYVLTVAHCVFHLYQHRGSGRYPLKVRLGEWDTQTTSEFLAHVDYEVFDILVHPEYKNASLWNDVALLKLKDNVLFAPHIDTVCLPRHDEIFAGQNCVVTGWGKDAYVGASFSNIMKEVTLQVVEDHKCEEMLRKTRLGRFFKLHEGFLCAGGEQGLDSCKGDGGGPLVCYRKDRSYTLAGLVSWGIDCGQSSVPGVYVKIQKYLDWISKSTGADVSNYWSK